jgi:hypothetical protein
MREKEKETSRQPYEMVRATIHYVATYLEVRRSGQN